MSKKKKKAKKTPDKDKIGSESRDFIAYKMAWHAGALSNLAAIGSVRIRRRLIKT